MQWLQKWLGVPIGEDCRLQSRFVASCEFLWLAHPDGLHVHFPRRDEGLFLTVIFHEYELVLNSGLFDPEYYVRSYEDVANLNVDPLVHYLEEGWQQGRSPSAKIDLQYYLQQCLAFGESPKNPIIHYVTVGMRRGLALMPETNKAAKRGNRKSKLEQTVGESKP